MNFFSALCHGFTGRKNFQVTNKAYFNIINLFVLASYSLFYCLITVSILSHPKQREKKKRRVLVYIFVRENSDIYRQTGLIVGRLELNA